MLWHPNVCQTRCLWYAGRLSFKNAIHSKTHNVSGYSWELMVVILLQKFTDPLPRAIIIIILQIFLWIVHALILCLVTTRQGMLKLSIVFCRFCWGLGFVDVWKFGKFLQKFSKTSWIYSIILFLNSKKFATLFFNEKGQILSEKNKSKLYHMYIYTSTL